MIQGFEYIKITKPASAFSTIPNDPQTLYNARIFLRRGGAFGDTLFALSVAAKIKAIQPNCTVAFACDPKFQEIAELCNEVDTVQDSRKARVKNNISAFDFLVDFGGVIEGKNGMAIRSDYYKAHYDRAGLEGNIIMPSFALPKKTPLEIRQYASKPFIMIHVGGSNVKKQWPLKRWQSFLNALDSYNVEYCLVGDARDSHIPPVGCRGKNFVGQTSFTDVLYLLKYCKGFLGTDSGISHLAGMLDIPAITLWGPFDPEHTVPHYPKMIPIKARGNCLFCETIHKPCEHGKSCMITIKPRSVFSIFQRKITLPKKKPAREDLKGITEDSPPVGYKYFQEGEEVKTFSDKKAPRVSVVIPNYKTREFLPKLYDTLATCDNTTQEVVLVTNGDSPYKSYGKEVWASEPLGFSRSCNLGVKYSNPNSEFICLLNADTYVTENWLSEMVTFLDKHPDVGLVGNLHVDFKGRIDSLGSEWSWKSYSFRHIGKNEVREHGFPKSPVERDMVTFACVLIRRSVWEDVGGLDEDFKKGYWEDSDFCMKVRQLGNRIFCVPSSVIYHKISATKINWHSRNANQKLFMSRWGESGYVNKFKALRGEKFLSSKIVACYIVLNEGPYIQASLESVYDFADEIIIVEGGNDYAVAAGWCGPDKHSTDDTIEQIQSFPDQKNKITLIQGQWKNKQEQRQAYANRLNPGDWMVLVDGDEIFFEEGLWRLSYLMVHYDIIRPGFFLFWNDFKTLGTGVWEDRFLQTKAVKWQEGYNYMKDHNEPWCNGQPIHRLPQVKVYHNPKERLYAHYAWVKPESVLRAKVNYYTEQTGRTLDKYFDDVFLKFREDQSVIDKQGSHPFGGGGVTRFLGSHPHPIQKRMEEGKFNYFWKEGSNAPR